MKTFKIKSNDDGRTILKYLEKMLKGVPKSRIEKLFRNKDVKLNNKRIKDKNVILNEEDIVLVYNVRFNEEKIVYKMVNKLFTVIYEDKNILVVSKKENVVISEQNNSLDNQIWAYLKFKQVDSFVPSSIGRIDKVTSGLIVYAKNYKALRHLKEKQAAFDKTYIFKSDLPSSTTTTFNIEHDELNKREVCGKRGKKTKTKFLIEGNKKTAKLFTGRKHQIRASLSKLGYPIYGDRKYGGKPASRVFLHSYKIKFNNLENEFAYLNEVDIVSKPNW